jgi:hypothetical protein
MTKNRCFLAAGLIALGVASSPALAASSRTFVSVTGTDSGSCPTAEPCRTFAYALTQTAPSGEIIVLSSGGYGAVTINKAVSIINTSNFAGVTVASGDGITINAGASDSIVLRGLTVDGGGTGSNGIVFNSGSKLTIDQCDVLNFVGGSSTGNGILMQPTSGNHNIILTNTAVSNNQFSGMLYFPTSGSATAEIVIDRVSANNNGNGIILNNNNSSGAAMASVSNSIASGNTNSGYSLGNVTASLDASYATNNFDGVFITSGTLALGRSVLMNNFGYGLYNASVAVNSYKDNRIAGNISGQALGTINPATLY